MTKKHLLLSQEEQSTEIWSTVHIMVQHRTHGKYTVYINKQFISDEFKTVQRLVQVLQRRWSSDDLPSISSYLSNKSKSSFFMKHVEEEELKELKSTIYQCFSKRYIL